MPTNLMLFYSEHLLASAPEDEVMLETVRTRMCYFIISRHKCFQRFLQIEIM